MELGACAGGVVGASLEAKMEVLRALGYDFIEPAWNKEEWPLLGAAFGAELRALGEKTGCPVRSAIYGGFPDLGLRLAEPDALPRELDILNRALETLAAAGGDVLLLPMWAGANERGYDDRYIEFLRAGGERAQKTGTQLAVEHIPGSKYRNTAAQTFRLIERTDHPRVGVYFDIVNVLHSGEEPVAAARMVAPRTKQYHVKDHKKAKRPLEAQPLVEVREVMAAAGFKGRVAVEMGPREAAEPRTNSHLEDAIRVLHAHGYGTPT